MKTLCLISIPFLSLLISHNGKAQSYQRDTIISYLIDSKRKANEAPKAVTPEYAKKLDSLLFKVKYAANDSMRIAAFDDIYYHCYYVSDFNGAKNASDSIIKIAEQTNDNNGRYIGYWGLADVQSRKGNTSESLVSYQQAYEALNKVQMNSQFKINYQGGLLNNIAGGFLRFDDLENSTLYYHKAIEYLIEGKDTSALATVYFNLSELFQQFDQLDKSYEYCKESLGFRTRENEWQQQISLSKMSVMCIKLNRLEESYSLLKDAEKLASGNPDNRYLRSMMLNNAKGQHYLHKKDYSKAEKFMIQAYRDATYHTVPSWILNQAREVGLYYFALREFKKAQHFFSITRDIALEFKYRYALVKAYADLSLLAEAQGLIKESLALKNLQIEQGDSLTLIQNHNRILFNNAKFEADKKQNEITQLQKDNEIKNLTIKQSRLWLYLAVVTVITLGIVGLLTYRNLKHKQNIARQKEVLQAQQIDVLEKDKQLILADAILKGQEQERGRLAKDLHDGLGGLLSGVKISLSNMKNNLIMTGDNALTFERSLDMLDNSIQELRRVSHNMMPEALVKFGLPEALRDFCESINSMKALNVQFQLVGEDRRIDSSQEIILYRVVQELLNNTLKHSGAKSSIVQLMFEPHSLSITVEDNGRGFEKSVLEKSIGSGWSNIQSRVDYLKGKLDVITKLGEGTSVHIRLMV